ncbi:MAG: TIGR00153 family protein [Elusimicrobiota bacterium]|nr:TIGR00153 family protein [Elusimicrobiota bacterium]
MFSRKKEKKVEKLIKEHLDTVVKTVKSMEETISCYVDGDEKGAHENAFKTHSLEGEADSKRREIIETLYKGAFMPAIREDLINYIAKQDKIADAAESCCDFIISQTPEVPETFREDFIQLARASFDTLQPLQTALDKYFNDYKKILSCIKDVNTREEQADTIEWHLTEKVFQSDELSLAQKIHLREFLFHVVHISDVIEDTADMLDSVVIKKSI